jgi:hypothetical protein
MPAQSFQWQRAVVHSRLLLSRVHLSIWDLLSVPQEAWARFKPRCRLGQGRCASRVRRNPVDKSGVAFLLHCGEQPALRGHRKTTYLGGLASNACAGEKKNEGRKINPRTRVPVAMISILSKTSPPCGNAPFKSRRAESQFPGCR